MRIAGLVSSFLIMVAAVFLFIADSVGPCEEIEAVQLAYFYKIACDGEEIQTGSVSFSNSESYAGWSFDVELFIDEVEGHYDADSGFPKLNRDNHDNPKKTDGEETEGKPDKENGGFFPEDDEEEDIQTIRLSFAVADKKMDLSECEPGKGTGYVEEMQAEAAFYWNFQKELFGCGIYPQDEVVECIPGPVRRHWNRDDNAENQEIPYSACEVTLYSAQNSN